MLTTLRIKNLALAEDLTIGFQPGLTAITGETGAGKSILIGALQLALGERADRGQIRAGAEQCAVEAVFELSPHSREIREFISSQGIDPTEDGQLFIKRTFSAGGTNRQFINGSPVPLQTLSQLGERLVDLHGPHDHQSLLHPPHQRDILDAYGNLQTSRRKFSAECKALGKIAAQKAELEGNEQTLEEQAELLRFQAGEIKNANLGSGEEAELEASHTRVSNASKALQLTQHVLGLLADDDSAILSQTAQVTRSMQELRRIDPETGQWLELEEQAIALLQELQNEARHYAEKIDLNPERLKEIEERIGLVQSLKRKYGRNIPEILAFGEAAAAKLEKLEGRKASLEALDREQSAMREQLWETGCELTRQRRGLIPRLVKATVAELKDLGFGDCRFDVAIDSEMDRSKPVWTNATGLDKVDFQFSPNVGEPLRPLRAIASSGELSRVMLALKTVLAGQDQVPLLVFDEIDANVGGETAAKVGEKMLQIARQHQVLCITHLAAVAAAAQNHLVVSKRVRDNRTLTEVTFLQAAERVDEIARMLGGRSRAALDHAQTLLQKR